MKLETYIKENNAILNSEEVGAPVLEEIMDEELFDEDTTENEVDESVENSNALWGT